MYNEWRISNPQKSIIDFCNENYGKCDLDMITDIITLCKSINIDSFSPQIESNIKQEITRIIREVINSSHSEIEEHFRERIEDDLNFELNFEFEGYDFVYSFAYDLGIEFDDHQFNEFIDFKIQSIPYFNKLLPSQQNRLRIMFTIEHAPMFLCALAKSLPNDDTIPININYEGFEFKYLNRNSLPKVILDDQIQDYLEQEYQEVENLAETDFINQIKSHCNTFFTDEFERIFIRNAPSFNSDRLKYQEYLNSHETRLKQYIKDNADRIRTSALLDKNLQEKINASLDGFENSITPNNIYLHISSFIKLKKLFEKYEELTDIKPSELYDNFYDSMQSTYREIIDIIVDNFNYDQVGNIITRDQLDNILDLCGIDDYLENLHLVNDIPYNFVISETNESSILSTILNSFEESIQDISIREEINKSNEYQKTIEREIKRDLAYNSTARKFTQAIESNDLLVQHRIIAALIHATKNKLSNLVKENNTNYQQVDDSLDNALKETEHYHKTFVLGNSIETLKYTSKTPEKIIEHGIAETLEKLSYSGRELNKKQQIKKIKDIIKTKEEDIVRWQQTITIKNKNIREILSDNNRSQKKRDNEINKIVKNNEIQELQSMRAIDEIAELSREIDLIKGAAIPNNKGSNILVPTFMFTIGYKDKDGKTIKREFIEIPIISHSDKPIGLNDFDENSIKFLVERADNKFKILVNKGKDIDTRDLETKHSFDSERIFNAFITKSENLQAILINLTEKLEERYSEWNSDGRTCKIYAITILAYSINATCRNCTRMYINLANDKSEGSFLKLITDAINSTPGLFAHSYSEDKEGIRFRSVIVADHDYHEHQKFVKSHPESIVHKGSALEIKSSDQRSFVEMIQHRVVAANESLTRASFKSGR